MNNTYLLAVCDGDFAWIESIHAQSITEAEDKFMISIAEGQNWEIPTDWDDFLQIAEENHHIIGNVEDIEELC